MPRTRHELRLIRSARQEVTNVREKSVRANEARSNTCMTVVWTNSRAKSDYGDGGQEQESTVINFGHDYGRALFKTQSGLKSPASHKVSITPWAAHADLGNCCHFCVRRFASVGRSQARCDCKAGRMKPPAWLLTYGAFLLESMRALFLPSNHLEDSLIFTTEVWPSPRLYERLGDGWASVASTITASTNIPQRSKDDQRARVSHAFTYQNCSPIQGHANCIAQRNGLTSLRTQASIHGALLRSLALCYVCLVLFTARLSWSLDLRTSLINHHIFHLLWHHLSDNILELIRYRIDEKSGI